MQPPLRRGSDPNDSDPGRNQPDENRRSSLLAAVLANPHAFHSADGFARKLGLRNRHHLNRLLREAGLPPFRTLATAVRLTSLLADAGAIRGSLCSASQRAGFDPAWVYRSLKRLTGRGWKELRGLSSYEVVRMTCARCDRARSGD
ncbi:MAG: hypothetical protein V4558_08285 [Gemmatimonadota bacterium]